MKLILDFKGGFKGFLLNYGAKIGLVAVVVFVGWLLYAGVRQEGLASHHQPQELQRLVTLAKENIDRGKYDELSEADKPPLKDYSPASLVSPVEEFAYNSPVPLDPLLFEPKIKRSDPQLLTIVDLEVNSGLGPFALRDPNSRQGNPFGGGGLNPFAGQSKLEDRKKTKERKRGQRKGEEQENQGGFPFGLAMGGREGIEEKRAVPQQIRRLGSPMTRDLKAEGCYWAVVLAKVPLTLQENAFDQVFIEAEGYNPDNDYPDYRAYQVQRAQITVDDTPEWKFLELVQKSSFTTLSEKSKVNERLKRIQRWSEKSEEIAHMAYVDEFGLLTHPLGPLVGRTWNRHVVHTEVPLAPSRKELLEAQQEGGNTAEETATTQTPAATGELAIDREEGPSTKSSPRRKGRQSPRGSGGGSAMGRMNPFGGSPLGGGMNPFGGSPLGRGMNPFGGGPLGGGMNPFGGGTFGGGSGLPFQEVVPYLLFRFFDFDVKPGQRYRYRVRLLFKDPNDDIPEKFLAKGVVRRRAELEQLENKKKRAFYLKYRWSEWSEASPPITIPYNGRILAASVKEIPPTRYSGEATANVLVKMFDGETGTDNGIMTEMYRGAMGVFREDVDSYNPRDPTYEITTVEDYNFRVDTMLLDMRGGETLTKGNKDLTSPGEILLIDPSGRLVVRSEIDDFDAVHLHQMTFGTGKKKGKKKTPDEEGFYNPFGNPFGGGMNQGGNTDRKRRSKNRTGNNRQRRGR